MRGLTVIGTIAMFMVGGGILTHGLHLVSEVINHIAALVDGLGIVGPVLAFITPSLLNTLFGLMAGAVALMAMNMLQRVKN